MGQIILGRIWDELLWDEFFFGTNVGQIFRTNHL